MKIKSSVWNEKHLQKALAPLTSNLQSACATHPEFAYNLTCRLLHQRDLRTQRSQLILPGYSRTPRFNSPQQRLTRRPQHLRLFRRFVSRSSRCNEKIKSPCEHSTTTKSTTLIVLDFHRKTIKQKIIIVMEEACRGKDAK